MAKSKAERRQYMIRIGALAIAAVMALSVLLAVVLNR